MKAGQSESPARYIRAHARVGIASSNNAYPSSEENLFSKVGMIASMERSTTGIRTQIIGHRACMNER